MDVGSKVFVDQLLSRVSFSDIISSHAHIVIEAHRGSGKKSPAGMLMLVRDDKHMNWASGRNKDSNNNTYVDISATAAELPSRGQPPREGSSQNVPAHPEDIFLVWVPYSYIPRECPKLLPAFPRNSPILGVTVVGKPGDSSTELSHITCIEMKCIDKIRRVASVGGKSVIEVYRLDSAEIVMLSFCQGGLTSFLAEMRVVSPMSQSHLDTNDFIVYGRRPKNLTTKFSSSEEERTTVMSHLNKLRSYTRSSFLNELWGTASGTGTPTALQPPTHETGDTRDMQIMLYGKKDSNPLATVATKLTNVFNSLLEPSPNSRDEFGSNVKVGPSLLFPCSDTPPKGDERGDFFHGEGGVTAQISQVELQVPRISRCENLRQMGPRLTANEWNTCFVGDERRVDVERFEHAKIVAYMGGIDSDIRLEVWCFMLDVYGCHTSSTESQRQRVRDEYRRRYEVLTGQWKSIFPEQEENFTVFREARVAVEKDVLRTDRFLPAYADECGEKLCMLRNVLLSRVMLNLDLGYCQGMSDILSPIALLAQDEVEAFMIFSCFIANHCCNDILKDVKRGMEQHLTALRALVAFSAPLLFNHLRIQGADDMFFCFRWLLVLFKREFPVEDAMLLWDVIICCPYTPRFEIFVAAALLKAFTPQILEMNLSHDELLKFVNSASCQLDVRHVIVLSQDFYLEVAKHVTTLGGGMVFRRGRLPTLEEVLQILEGNTT